MAESTFIKFITTAFGTAIVYLLGGADILFNTLFIFIILDFISGMFKGAKKGELNSMRGYQGIMKKVGVMMGVIVAVQLDRLTGSDGFRTTTITFFTINEAISILENIKIIGVELPHGLVKFLEVWKDKEISKGVGEIEDNISSGP